MKIENNIIKNNLKNVYFISGNACGGKTTMSKKLAEKYGLLLYDMDAQYPVHRGQAKEAYQPDMCYHCSDFHEQFTRPIEEQARWNMSSLREQSDMVIMDLIKLSENQQVVADVLFMEPYINGLVDYNQIIFLTVDENMIREIYFKREEKRGFYDHVNKQVHGDIYFENIFLALERTNRIENEFIRNSGFKYLERTSESTVDGTLKELELHFGLIEK